MTTLKPRNDVPKHHKKARRVAIILTGLGVLTWLGISLAGAAYLWDLAS